MKHIRNILLLITIIFAFVMQAEVYQNMLWNFNGAYYLSSRYTTTNDDMDSFLANAEDTAEKHGVHIFSTFNQRVSNYQTRLYIYGDDTVVRDSLKSTMDIEEKTYTAFRAITAAFSPREARTTTSFCLRITSIILSTIINMATRPQTMNIISVSVDCQNSGCDIEYSFAKS